MIKLSNLYKSYGKVAAVNNLDLEINNELFVFLGPNGAGKTTTIKMMTGLIQPSQGAIEIGGIDMLQYPETAKAKFGLVPEEPFLYEKLTGIEYIRFIATLHKVPHSLIEIRMQQLFDIFNIQERVGDFIEDYSHGMKQKIAIVAALIHDPQVLILDEPTSGLDPKAVRNLKDLLKGWVEKGRTVFMSTHILEIAESMCDRIGIINKGELVALGTPAELRNQYSNNGTLEDLFLDLTDSAGSDSVHSFLNSEL